MDGDVARSRRREAGGRSGYGLVCDAGVEVVPDLVMVDANQEHGSVAHRWGDPARLPELPVDTLLRVLPDHACATPAQHGRYQVVSRESVVTAAWPRCSGW